MGALNQERSFLVSVVLTDQPWKTMMQEMKKSRTSNEFQIDRLSDLPDCLIHNILVLLDIKTAIQTCVLSKRWNNLWTSLPQLHFDSRSFNKLTPFKKFVLNVLSRCKDNGLFSLRFFQASMDRSFIHRVLRYAASHGVQEVTLQHHLNGLHIAHFLCSCKSLKTLELQACKLSESNFFEPLSKCVNLENLKIFACNVECGKTIKLSAPRLVNLTLAGTVKNCLPGQKNQVVLCAPRLSSFFYVGGYPLALSMNGCPILQRMGICLDAPSNKTQDNVEAYYSDTKNLLQEVCCYAKIIQIQLDSWEVRMQSFF
ncbi:hypothetical protein CCACVL1_22458 [Corchorus capsularis]|uniref:F-box domain-containing protein n=1 Tax=Corchorus capsularis TaxID=210143 RepID=A0A1R3GYI1_COCAP|nr:hypothetical protein CCACVL1_22458 [Corchorus capsularis]